MPTVNNDEFRRNFAKLIARAGRKLDYIPRWSALEIQRRLVMKSPVGDPSMWANPDSKPPGYVGGRFKANWRVHIGSINFDNTATPDPSGGRALTEGQGVVARLEVGPTIYITNSVPYSRRIEYDSWSKQASAGVVRTTVAEFKQIVTEAARQIP